MTATFRCAAYGSHTDLRLVQPVARRRTGTTSTLRPSLRRRLAVVAVAVAGILSMVGGRP